MSFDHTVDVLVVGSGGGALTSAIAAQDRNANVLVVEKSNQYGGTSAMSGGSIWIPNSHLSTVAGGEDSREAALEYILTSVGDRADRKRIEAYVDFGPRMLKFLEENHNFDPVHFQVFSVKAARLSTLFAHSAEHVFARACKYLN